MLVPTNRNRIRGCISRVKYHIILKPKIIKVYVVDPAAIDRKKMQLPGEILTLSNLRRKSAEAIVSEPNRIQMIDHVVSSRYERVAEKG